MTTLVIQRSGKYNDGDEWVARRRHAMPTSGGYGPWDTREAAVETMGELVPSIPGVDRLLVREGHGYEEVLG